MEPITRQEIFLANAAGESTQDLKPITRLEHFLKNVADHVKSIGDGGWRKIIDYTATEQIFTPDIPRCEFTEDLNGNPLSVKNLFFKFSGIITGGNGFRITCNQNFLTIIHGTAGEFGVSQGFIAHVPGYFSALAAEENSLTVQNRTAREPSGKETVESISFSGPNYNAIHLEAGAHIEVWEVTGE